MESEIKEIEKQNTAVAVFCSAIAVLFVMLGVFIYKGFFPMGKSSVMMIDMYSQYIPLLYRFYDVVAGHKNLFYEFDILAGANLYGDTINEIINPFNYILFLFSRDQIYLSVNIILISYLMAMAGGATYVLKKLTRASGRMCAVLGICYALSGYTAYNYEIIKWMYLPVLFPFFFLALVRLLQGKKGFGYALLLAYQLMLSIQLGFMTLLFSLFIGGLYVWICVEKEERGKRLTSMVIWTILGVGLSCVVVLPMGLVLLESARSGENSNYFGVMKQHGLDDLFERIFQIGHPVLIGMILHRFSQALERKKLKKLHNDAMLKFTAVSVIFLWITVFVQPANLLWHMGSYTCFPVRYAYMVLFMMCLLVAQDEYVNGMQMLGGYEQNEFLPNEDIRTKVKIESADRNSKAVKFAGLALMLAITGLRIVIEREKNLTEAFSSLAISLVCPQEVVYVGIVMVLFVTAITLMCVCFVRDSENNQEKIFKVLGFGSIAALWGFTVFCCICLPPKAMIRSLNEAAYHKMTSAYHQSDDSIENAETLYDRTKEKSDLPLNAALVTGKHSLSGYIPTGSAKYQKLMAAFGYDTAWVSVSDNGGSSVSDELLTSVYCIPNEDVEMLVGDAGKSVASEEEALKQFFGNMRKFSDIGGTITVDLKKLNWEITLPETKGNYVVLLPVASIDGFYGSNNDAELMEVFGGLVGIYPDQSITKLTLSYRVPGLLEGLVISGVAALISLLFVNIYEEERNIRILSGLYRVAFIVAMIGIYVVPTVGMVLFMCGKIIGVVK